MITRTQHLQKAISKRKTTILDNQANNTQKIYKGCPVGGIKIIQAEDLFGVVQGDGT